MPERVVTDPGGRTWHVHRQWLPRRARWLGIGFKKVRHPDGDRDHDVPGWLVDIPGGEDLPGLAVVIAVIVALVLAWLFVFPALVFALDLLLLLVIAALGVATRVLFRRPWVVEASTTGPAPERRGWPVVGWRASGEAVTVVADALAAGREPVIPRRAGEPAPPV